MATMTANETETATAAEFNMETGFKVSCPHCGNTEGLRLKTESFELVCDECSALVERADLQRVIAEASRLIRFLDLAATV